MSTSKKRIFITGSSSGLGRAAVKLFASKGWKVIATMRTPEKETELASIPGVKLMALDTTDADQIQRVARDVIAHGGVDVVFNNAGYGMERPFLALSRTAWAWDGSTERHAGDARKESSSSRSAI